MATPSNSIHSGRATHRNQKHRGGASNVSENSLPVDADNQQCSYRSKCAYRVVGNCLVQLCLFLSAELSWRLWAALYKVRPRLGSLLVGMGVGEHDGGDCLRWGSLGCSRGAYNAHDDDEDLQYGGGGGLGFRLGTASPRVMYICIVQRCGLDRQCICDNCGLRGTSLFTPMSRPSQVSASADNVKPGCIRYS